MTDSFNLIQTLQHYDLIFVNTCMKIDAAIGCRISSASSAAAANPTRSPAGDKLFFNYRFKMPIDGEIGY